MSTRAFDLATPGKFSSFKEKNKVPAPETSAPTAGPKDNLLAEMAIDVKNSTSNGNHAHIDFQGDFRPIIMALCYYAASNYDSLNVKNSSKVSPPTLVAYFLFVIYSFYLLCDLEARPTPSDNTRFIHTPEYIDLKNLILQLPVPTILVKFLQAIAPTADPRRPNITFVPTFACFSHSLDFGRYFPIGIFIQAHNFVINEKTNDPAATLMPKLLFQLVNSKQRIAQFFGQLLPTGSAHLDYGNQLMQAFEGIINPALARSRSQRNVYSRISFINTDWNDLENPYQYLMNVESDNYSETMTLIRQLQTIVSRDLPTSGTLGSVTANLTGMNILIHGYSDFAVPTWHTTPISTQPTSTTLSTAKTYAAAMGLFSTNLGTPATTLKYPTDDKTIETPLYLVQKTNGTGYPTEDDLVHFSKDKRQHRNLSVPPVRVLDPYDYNATTFHNIFLSGALIESQEIDASIVPHPNIDSVLDDENTLFLQSALAYSHVRPGTDFVNQTTPIWLERRVPIGPEGQPASTLLYDAGSSRLGTFNKTVHAAITSLPGFHILESLTHAVSVFNRLAFRIPNPDEKNSADPKLPSANKVLVWSPYRYYNGRVMTTTNDNYFVITNLRTIFGTNPPLGEVSHFLEVMPVA